jgi:hypothetical protein
VIPGILTRCASPKLVAQALETSPLLALAEDHQRPLGPLGRDIRKRAKEQVEPFLWDQAADCDDPAALVR